ncbi:hypothetical protein ORI99_00265 [Alishewanella sp. SMS9]|nr:hypothetical protein [Alishewanella sp. SMS9]
MMNKKHCKAECEEAGICQTCGDVFHGEKKQCPMEIYDDGYPFETGITDKLLMVLMSIAGAAGLAKAFGVW